MLQQPDERHKIHRALIDMDRCSVLGKIRHDACQNAQKDGRPNTGYAVNSDTSAFRLNIQTLDFSLSVAPEG